MTYRFASETDVSPSRSRVELQELLDKAGCTGFAFVTRAGAACVAFELDGRHIRCHVPIPDHNHPLVAATAGGRYRPESQRKIVIAQLERVRWRTLVLAVKAKLAAVEAGLQTVESAFLADIVLPSGRTVGEETEAAIASAYAGKAVPLLGAM